MVRRTCATALLVLGLIAAVASAAEIRGVVGKIDPAKNEITLEARGPRVRGQTFTFTLAPDTPVLVGGQPARLSDLSPGKRVRVTYEPRDGKFVATSVRSLSLLISLDPAPAPAPVPATAPATGETVSGELRRVARTDRELVVLSPDGRRETVLAVPEDVAVTRHGRPARFEDLKEGEQATVKHGLRDGKAVALAVQVGDGPPAAAAPEDNRIQRIRRVLKMVDLLLDLADRSK